MFLHTQTQMTEGPTHMYKTLYMCVVCCLLVFPVIILSSMLIILLISYLIRRGRDSVYCVQTRYGLDCSGIESR